MVPKALWPKRSGVATALALLFLLLTSCSGEAQMPTPDAQLGFMEDVEPHLDEKLAPTVAEGAARPLAPGEYILTQPGKSDDWASEMTTTVQRQDGQWVNLPMLWIKDGKPYVAADGNEALTLAENSGLNFKSFPDEKSANTAAEEREAGWQDIEPANIPTDAAKVAPLWEAQASPLSTPTATGKPAPSIVLPDIDVTPNPLKAVPGVQLKTSRQ